jgi:hypothetical protein
MTATAFLDGEEEKKAGRIQVTPRKGEMVSQTWGSDFYNSDIFI